MSKFKVRVLASEDWEIYKLPAFTRCGFHLVQEEKVLLRHFLNEMKKWALNKECTSMALSVTTINNAAVGLYQSYGFSPVGDIEELRVGSELLVQPMVMGLHYAV